MLNSQIVGYIDENGDYKESVALRSSTSNDHLLPPGVYYLWGDVPEGYYANPQGPRMYYQVTKNMEFRNYYIKIQGT